MATGPTVRRRRLGAELRRLRDSAGYKLEEVAGMLGVAPSTLSRIETGKAPTKSAYLSHLLELYQVTDPGQRQILVDMAREGHRKGWWAAYDDVLPSGLGVYVGLEAEASGLRSYEIGVVHGLLQTTDYARAILRASAPRHTADQIERLVDLRMERQRRLDDNPPLDLWVIHDEAVIRRTVGGPVVMRHQLAHLLVAAGLPGVTSRCCPSTPARTRVTTAPFPSSSFTTGPILKSSTSNRRPGRFTWRKTGRSGLAPRFLTGSGPRPCRRRRPRPDLQGGARACLTRRRKPAKARAPAVGRCG